MAAATNVTPIRTAIRGYEPAPKAVRSRMDTIIVSREDADKWVIRPFQRALKINAKVTALAEELKTNGGVLPGVITLGTISPDKTFNVVDGQHRIEAFRMSGLPEFIADVRICDFDTYAEMAAEFVQLQQSLVRMKPDDVMRGLETSVASLGELRKLCPYVGYDSIRRGTTSPIVGMSSLLRAWDGSSGDTPTNKARTAIDIANELNDPAALAPLVGFLRAAEGAWGRDPEYYRLWSGLNLIMCMWIWRQMVAKMGTGKRHLILTSEQFKKCLMSVSASREYLDWLPGRAMGDRDRAPCYARLRAIFTRRLAADLNLAPGGRTRPVMPGPSWSSNSKAPIDW